MRLFGEQGYAATSVAQIEEAAGLRPGGGGLYRHFPSKRDVLEQGIRAVLEGPRDVFHALETAVDTSQRTLPEQLRAIAEAGLYRLDHDRDLSRILIRDLRDFPELALLVRQSEIDAVITALASWLRANAQRDVDADGIAAVAVAAISHYWTIQDATGAPLYAMDRRRFLDALVSVIDGALHAP